MGVVIAQDALVELSVVLGELGLGADQSGSPVTRLINGASKAITQYIDRKLAWQNFVENYGNSGSPGQARLSLDQSPVYPKTLASILSVETFLDPNVYEGVGPEVLTPGQDYYFEDADRGWLFRQVRWVSTAIRRPDIVQDPEPGMVELTTQVSYLAGHVTPVQINAAVAWPGEASTVAACLMVTPAAHTSQVWGCTTPGVTGSVEPTWGSSPAQFSTITDGTAVWTFLGYNTTVTTYPQARTLPVDIEQAAVDTVVTWYRRRGSTLEPTTTKFGDSSKTYGERLGLPSTAIKLLTNYRTVSIG